jgi:hypothetical protein
MVVIVVSVISKSVSKNEEGNEVIVKAAKGIAG